MRALAGDDSVKSNIVKDGGAQLIDEIINIHKVKFESSLGFLIWNKIEIFCFFFLQENELFARAALACLSTLTLRSTENSQALFEVGSAETIVETMKLHPKSKLVMVKCFK